MQKKTVCFGTLLILFAATVFAGSITGTVKASGLRSNADAVVYIDTINGKSFDPPKTNVRMDQIDMEFIPHVLPVLVGTTVEFLNSDAFLHNVFTPDRCAGKFNLGTWPKGQTKDFTFEAPCVATVLCNVHPEMEAFVVAVPTPYFAVSDRKGSFTIADVPDGTYTVKVWHPKLKEVTREVTVSGETAVSFELER